MKHSSFLLAALLLTTGCCGPHVKDYANKAPNVDVRDFMNGDLTAFGVFFMHDGTADPRFTIKMHGEFTDTDGTLSEAFTYTDGHSQQRLWHFHFTDDHHFTGTADDVIGVAQGTQYGNAVNMKYTIRLKTEAGKTYDLATDDWLYYTDDRHLVNRTQLSKYGYKAGELFISIQKAD